MPILKIPVRHSFGIVARNAGEEGDGAPKSVDAGGHNRPLFEEETLPEVNEAFVDAFNTCEDLDRPAFISLCEKILFRLKRLAGVSKCKRLRTNIAKAWFELSLLTNCMGTVSDIAYDLLVCSLEKTPLDGNDMAILLHVGEMALSKVKHNELVAGSDEQHSKLMAVLELTFQRLLFYQRVGMLAMCGPHLDQYIARFVAINNKSTINDSNPGAQYTIYFVTEVLKCMRSGMAAKNWLIECLKLLRDVEWERLSESAVDRLLMVLPGKLGGDGTWLDSVILFKVLGHAAEAHVSVLRLLQCIVTRTMSACPWELLYKYTQILAHIGLHGKTSAIKKMALEGCSTFKLGNFEFHGTGLLALRFYHDIYSEENSWKVRFGTVESLTMLWQCGEGGVRTVAYTALDEMREREKDSRVMLAVRFGNIRAAFDRLLTAETPSYDTAPGSLDGKMMMGLALHHMTEEDNPFGKILAPLRDLKAASSKPKKKQRPQSQGPRQTLDNKLLPELLRGRVDYKTRCALELQHMFDEAFREKMRDEETGTQRKLPLLPPSPFNEPAKKTKSRGKKAAAHVSDAGGSSAAATAGGAAVGVGESTEKVDAESEEDDEGDGTGELVRSPSWVIDEVERMEREVREFELQIRTDREKHIAKLVHAVTAVEAKKARKAKLCPRIPNHSKGALTSAVTAYASQS